MCARDVLLIDEMSLITPNMLADIDRALKKATRCEHDFGNWLVILSGDEAEIEAGSDEDVPGGSDPIVRALGRARGGCLLYTSPSPRDAHESRMPSSA